MYIQDLTAIEPPNQSYCDDDSDGDDTNGFVQNINLDALILDPSATEDDGSCLVAGCLIPFACNYDPDADYYLAGSCDFSCL